MFVAKTIKEIMHTDEVDSLEQCLLHRIGVHVDHETILEFESNSRLVSESNMMMNRR